MAEAIGLTASIITLLQISYATTRVAYKDVHRVFNAEKEMKNLSVGLSGLDQALTSIEQLTMDDPHNKTLRPLWLLRKLSAVLNDSKEELEQIQVQLKRPSGKSVAKRGWSALQWPIKEKEVRQSLDRLKDITKSLELAIGTENISIGRETQKLLYDTKRLIEQDQLESIAKEICGWLQRADPSTNHSTALALHEPGTGLWLPQRAEYRRFKAELSQIVWIDGILGSGKTILCSSIIEDIRADINTDEDSALVYFYFDFHSSRKQNVSDFLRSLLAQFIRPCEPLPRPVEELYNRYKTQRCDPSTDDLFEAFLSACARYRKVYLVADALDECSERDKLLSTIDAMVAQSPASLSMLFISRQERDIEDTVGPLASSVITMEAKAIESDIRLYVSNELSRDKDMKKFPQHLQEEIKEALVSKADGMFRWVYCQLLRLRKCKNSNAVRHQLASLPRDLDETYERVLKSVEDEDRPKARAILTWLAFSTRPLFLDQIAEIAAIDPDTKCLNKNEQLFQKNLALDFCPGLIRVCEKIQKGWDRTGYVFYHDNVIRLAHFSVKEYLVSERIRESSAMFFFQEIEMANREIAETCLSYLVMLTKPLSPTCFIDYPLLSYAAKHWPKHFQLLSSRKDKDALVPLLQQLFMGKPQCFRNWIHVLDPWALKQHEPIEDQFLRDLDQGDEISSPLYVAARFGILQVVKQIIEDDPDDDVDATGGVLGPPIAAAISAEDPSLRTGVTEDHREVVRLLVEHGADVHAGGMMGANMLLYAFAPENIRMLQQLIEAGASVNARNPDEETLLHLAISENYPEAAEQLLEHGAELEARDKKGRTPLLSGMTSPICELETIRRLLDRGADINAQDSGACTPLHYAVGRGSEDFALLLLLRNCRTDIANDKGFCPFDKAWCNMQGDAWARMRSKLQAASRIDPCAQGALSVLIESGIG